MFHLFLFWASWYFLGNHLLFFPWIDMESVFLLDSVGVFFFFACFQTATAKGFITIWNSRWQNLLPLVKELQDRGGTWKYFQCPLENWLDVRGWKQRDPAVCRTLGARPFCEASQLARVDWVFDYCAMLKGHRVASRCCCPFKNLLSSVDSVIYNKA